MTRRLPYIFAILSPSALILLVIFSFHFGGALDNRSPQEAPREVVHLLDYLAQDYSGAVKDGKVISKSEYQEQNEFSESAARIARAIPTLQKHPEILNNLEGLKQLIAQKASPLAVAALAQQTKSEVIKITDLPVAPDRWPSLAYGQNLFEKNCVTCHGPKGDGDGPAARSLNPRPTNFLSKKMDNLSPFKAFNAIRVGVPGTAMAPQTLLTDQEVWNLAFYIMSIRSHSSPVDTQNLESTFRLLLPKFGLEKVATLTDQEIKDTLEGSEDQRAKNLVVLRTHSGDDENHDSLQTARAELQKSLDEYRAGRKDSAKSKSLVAYLEGIEPVEPRLRASDPALTSELENRMAMVRSEIEAGKPIETVSAAIDSANQEIDVAGMLLNQGAPSPWLTFLIAAAILLREGFEAFLIVVALLGVIRASGDRKAHRWIHGGWMAALLLGVVAWFLSGWLLAISGAQRELMEGVTSVLAVAVLLYMGFWLHRTTEIGRWTKFINTKVRTALKGERLLGLAAISFVAVFREAFETVLFLRALWLEGGMSTKWAMLAGTVGALTLIFILAWLILRYTARIPVRRLFDFSSSLMTVLAVILAGKGLHSFQETGLLGVTPSPFNIHIDVIGFYPTLETILAQLAILVLALSLWFFGKRPSVKVPRGAKA